MRPLPPGSDLAGMSWGFRCLAISALATALLAGSCNAVIIGAAVIPHGDFAFDPGLVNGTGGATKLHEASMLAGEYIDSLRPDVVFMTTPHGLELRSDFLVYLNTHLAGASPLGDVPHHAGPQTVPMNLTTDTRLANTLLDRLTAEGLNVEGLLGFSDSEPLPISWGEILPMTYLAPRNFSALPPVVVMGMPTRRFNHSAEMVGELITLGNAVGAFLEDRPERVAWVVSADLAHTHLASGPYGFCPCAQPFDEAVQRWAARGDSAALLVNATKYQKLGAASCGFTGLVALEGMLHNQGRDRWLSESLANYHPTYYGMLVATFRREQSPHGPDIGSVAPESVLV